MITPLLLNILQNWTADNPEIFANEQMLTVTSLLNDTTPVLTSGNPNQTSNNKTKAKNEMILFTAIGSAGGLSLFLCIFCIIISVYIFKKLKSKENDNLKERFAVYII